MNNLITCECGTKYNPDTKWILGLPTNDTTGDIEYVGKLLEHTCPICGRLNNNGDCNND